MSTCVFRDATEIGDFGEPYVVAEVNTSHNGSMDRARAMIDQAQAAGCRCVKFQSWSDVSLYSKTYYDGNPIARKIVRKFSLNETQIVELARYCRGRGIAFASTPYSRREVDLLVDACAVPYVKVASMDLNNLPFLEYIARTGVPIVLSTGMGELDEIRRAVAAIQAAGNRQLCLLHCISIYPPKIPDIQLLNIAGLRQEFPECPVGFSDHSLGIEMAAAATALGAAMIEKHLTLDRSIIGMDNQMALEPSEMAQLVRDCRNVHAAMGGRERVVSPAELEQRQKMRRSVVAARDLPVGTVLGIDDLDAKRPGSGIPPDRIGTLVGRTLGRAVEKDAVIALADLID
jgi:N-acetylneuraminate synthase